MNDDDRQALLGRIHERLGNRPTGIWLGWKAIDYTRDANAALRDLAPLLPSWQRSNVLEFATYDHEPPWDEAVALAICVAVDKLP